MRYHIRTSIQSRRTRGGFTLLEIVLVVAITSIIGIAISQAYVGILNTYQVAKTRLAAITIGNEEIEFARNLPYAQVGIEGGIPSGILASSTVITRDGTPFLVQRFIRNIDDGFDGILGGVPNDLSPADYKLVSLDVTCIACPRPERYSVNARVAPLGLETGGSNGALFIQVIDASGLGLQGATVELSNSGTDPPISITDVTDNEGWLRVVDVPPANQSYRVNVSKLGYSIDRTYATSTQNPNPAKPHATVAQGTVTQTTFAIDRTSQLDFTSVTDTCAWVADTDFSFSGSKLIGSNPDVLKYSADHTTDGAGQKSVAGLEWDTYAVTLTDAEVSTIGMIPLSPISLSPNVTQTVSLITHPKAPNELVVSVRDTSTRLPLSDATVILSKTGYLESKTTGIGFLKQTDWSGGFGQRDFIDASQYLSQDGTIAVNTPAGELKLIEISPGMYAASGELMSSSFDAGTAATFKKLSWNPGSQPPDTGLDPVRIQLASDNDPATTTWNYFGPDGAAATFYTPLTPDINPIHSGDRYIRYRALLSTASTTFTPSISDVTFTFSAGCVPSGQVNFSGLSLDTYTVSVSRVGYQPFSEEVILTGAWQEKEILLSP